MTPKVSVVVPTYQRATLLRETVAQLLGQTLKDIEIIVVDDGSTDETPAVMSSFDDPRVHYARRDHLGMPGILNEGFAAARGTYVMTCHDHDIYSPRLLEDLADALDRHPTAAYAHCGVVVVDVHGARALSYHAPDYPELYPGRQFLVEELLQISPVSALTMVRASVVSARPFDPRFGGCADVELWLRLSRIGDVAYVKGPLIWVRERDLQSAWYAVSWQLTDNVLEMKKPYLRFVTDPAGRAKIEKEWRRLATRSGLQSMLRVLDGGRGGNAGEIATFVRREGTSLGRLAARILASSPRAMAVNVLRAGRMLDRTRRYLIGRQSRKAAAASNARVGTASGAQGARRV